MVLVTLTFILQFILTIMIFFILVMISFMFRFDCSCVIFGKKLLVDMELTLTNEQKCTQQQTFC